MVVTRGDVSGRASSATDGLYRGMREGREKRGVYDNFVASHSVS